MPGGEQEMSKMIRALAVTVSNRAAAGVYADRSGPVLADRQSRCCEGRVKQESKVAVEPDLD